MNPNDVFKTKGELPIIEVPVKTGIVFVVPPEVVTAVWAYKLFPKANTINKSALRMDADLTFMQDLQGGDSSKVFSEE